MDKKIVGLVGAISGLMPFRSEAPRWLEQTSERAVIWRIA